MTMAKNFSKLMKDAFHRLKKFNAIKQDKYQNIHNQTYDDGTVKH